MTSIMKRKLEDNNDLSSKRNKPSLSFNIFSDKFSPETMNAIESNGFTNITKIQLYAIPPIMLGHDVLGVAKTGSGKTLAFLLPIIEKIPALKRKYGNVIFSIIIAPTRELAIQIEITLKNLTEKHDISYALITGGRKLSKEKKLLENGTNVLIATPGRLLDHLNNGTFATNKLRFLVIDEVDKILDTGFEKDMKKILGVLNSKKRQTIMFSATKSDKISDMEKLALKNEPIVINVDEDDQESTIKGLSQFYVLCPTHKKFVYLHYLLMKSRNKKVMVFFDTTAEVEFFYNFYKSFDSQFTLIQLHGKKKQSTRTNSFLEFCNASTGTIFCTDVAARGLDIPDVDCIIQYDAPKSSKTYIHRVGRTARGGGKIGKVLLLLHPSEEGFAEHMRNEKIPIEKLDVNWEKVKDHQSILEDIVSKNDDLVLLAKEAYKKYLQSYRMKGQKYFDGRKLNYEELLSSFGIKHRHINYKTLFQSIFNK